ncbi:hypothetical protein ELE36_08040 [Pseudolysobacter antarcticus]|uniref:Uncharacterized protein n=1 Tax=Pseudolysobacter antarcticus TaxID=2511995 RepID=A0A411HIH2_9GAMM|nr:hypothetical protein [Pseudolysobacter antarcticus]QBB70316.1 hypothetical protein ELE36_08040 [Pseudolysobacter antarcticus]
MKFRLLSGALLTALAGTAGAVSLNPQGIGQVLLYPYFTVNANNQTLVSVVNTQNAGKVAKVRFLEGYNGREVLDFNLYLSPYDVWTATIFDTAGVNQRPNDDSVAAALLTPDSSCTDPAIKTGTAGLTELLLDGRNFVAFSNHAYSAPAGDGGPTELSRTRTGHIELIEMASVIGTTLTNIRHINGVPKNCGAIIGAQNSADYSSPTGGLFGSASIVNTLAGTLYGYNAEALNGFYTNAGNLFGAAGSPSPDLSSGDNGNISPGNEVSYVFGEDGSLITSSWPLSNGGSIDAVSSIFTADQIFNEFELNPIIGSVASEWMVTFPTKHYYADATLSSPVQPFTHIFGSDSTRPASACELMVVKIYDREERTPQSTGSIGVPTPLPLPTLCWESQVIVILPAALVSIFGSPIFGSPLMAIADPFKYGSSFTSGTLAITLSGNGHALRTSNEGNAFAGLPVIGFLAKDFTNKNVTPGVLGNYAGLFRHHISQACSNTSGSCH